LCKWIFYFPGIEAEVESSFLTVGIGQEPTLSIFRDSPQTQAKWTISGSVKFTFVSQYPKLSDFYIYFYYELINTIDI